MPARKHRNRDKPTRRQRKEAAWEAKKARWAEREAALMDPEQVMGDIAWESAPRNGNPFPEADCGGHHDDICWGQRGCYHD